MKVHSKHDRKKIRSNFKVYVVVLRERLRLSEIARETGMKKSYVSKIINIEVPQLFKRHPKLSSDKKKEIDFIPVFKIDEYFEQLGKEIGLTTQEMVTVRDLFREHQEELAKDLWYHKNDRINTILNGAYTPGLNAVEYFKNDQQDQ